MKTIEEKNIGSVEVDDSEIVFTDKDNQNIYKTGEMNDPTLTERLYESGRKIHPKHRKGYVAAAQLLFRRPFCRYFSLP